MGAFYELNMDSYHFFAIIVGISLLVIGQIVICALLGALIVGGEDYVVLCTVFDSGLGSLKLIPCDELE